MMDSANVISEYPVRVYYEDVDLGGIVYHSKYLNFCERARSEIFFERGRSPVIGEYHFVVKHIDASFKAPAKFSDMLLVQTEFVKQRKASFTLRQRVVSEAGDRLYFVMEVELVCLKGESVSIIPPGILELFGIDSE
jgi:acyl-CoA thioester hydrolase